MRQLTLALTAGILSLAAPAPLWAAGSDDPFPPKTTKTTTECKTGEIYDEKTKSCVEQSSSLLNEAKRFAALRELAYAGQYERALSLLDALPESSFTLTYRGFIARKKGAADAADRYYLAAIAADGDNLLARSYFGQGLAQSGKRAAAKAQLTQIRKRGGRNSWPEFALVSALRGGIGSNY